MQANQRISPLDRSQLIGSIASAMHTKRDLFVAQVA
jgi:hypothetical protein